MDHHCIWLNVCIGYLNHKPFILFLVCHALASIVWSLLSILAWSREVCHDMMYDIQSVRLALKATAELVVEYGGYSERIVIVMSVRAINCHASLDHAVPIRFRFRMIQAQEIQMHVKPSKIYFLPTISLLSSLAFLQCLQVSS